MSALSRFFDRLFGLFGRKKKKTDGWKQLPLTDPRVADAIQFARKVLGIAESHKMTFFSAPGTHPHPDGGKGVPSLDGSGRIVRGRTFPSKGAIRTNVYHDNGYIPRDTLRHEAVHNVGWFLLGHGKGAEYHPKKAPNGKQLIYKVPNWS